MFINAAKLVVAVLAVLISLSVSVIKSVTGDGVFSFVDFCHR